MSRHAHRPEDAALELVLEAVSAGAFDDHARQDVSGRRVVPRAPGLEVRLVGDPRDEVGRRIGAGPDGTRLDHPRLKFRHVVGHAAGHVEQLAQADLLAIVEAAGQPLLHGVVEGQPALGGELQRDRGDERLRVAAGAKPVGRPQRAVGFGVSDAGGVELDAVSVVDERDDAGGARIDHLLELPRERGALRERGAVRAWFRALRRGRSRGAVRVAARGGEGNGGRQQRRAEDEGAGEHGRSSMRITVSARQGGTPVAPPPGLRPAWRVVAYPVVLGAPVLVPAGAGVVS